MGIFRKNKRHFVFRSHRRVFVTLFLVGILSISGVISFILRAQATDGPIRSIEILSEHANFSNNEQGAWKITKSAKWTSKTTAQVTFEIDSIAKPSGNDKDIILVLDNSSSMDDSIYDNNTTTSKLEAIKTKAVVEMLAKLGAAKKVLLVTENADEVIYKSARNIEGVKVATVNTINVYDILNCDSFIVLKDAAKKIEEVYA
jgi:hypothetical protein